MVMGLIPHAGLIKCSRLRIKLRLLISCWVRSEEHKVLFKTKPTYAIILIFSHLRLCNQTEATETLPSETPSL